MNFSELVKIRYSCRKYIKQGVERVKIEQCIDAARRAPSACNAQPWKFIVVDDPEKLAAVSEAAVKGLYGAPRLMAKAPTLIVVQAEKGTFTSKVGAMVRDTSFYLIDIGIACEHLVLQAAELGLGTCYIGWFNEKQVKKELGLKKSDILPLVITMGYPDEEYYKKDLTRRLARGDNRKPLDEILKFE